MREVQPGELEKEKEEDDKEEKVPGALRVRGREGKKEREGRRNKEEDPFSRIGALEEKKGSDKGEWLLVPVRPIVNPTTSPPPSRLNSLSFTQHHPRSSNEEDPAPRLGELKEEKRGSDKGEWLLVPVRPIVKPTTSPPPSRLNSLSFTQQHPRSSNEEDPALRLGGLKEEKRGSDKGKGVLVPVNSIVKPTTVPPPSRLNSLPSMQHDPYSTALPSLLSILKKKKVR